MQVTFDECVELVNQLRREKRLLQAECDGLRGRLISAGLEPPAVDLPSDDECERLLTMVRKKWPQLKDEGSVKAHREAFRNSIHFLTFCQRKDGLDRTFAATHHHDLCERWLAKFNLNSNYSAFLQGVVVMRFLYSSFERYPFDLELGIVANGYSLRADSTPWRDTLAKGLIEPTPLNRQTGPVLDRDMVQPSPGDTYQVKSGSPRARSLLIVARGAGDPGDELEGHLLGGDPFVFGSPPILLLGRGVPSHGTRA